MADKIKTKKPVASERQKELLGQAREKIKDIQKKMFCMDIDANGSPQKVNWADVGTTAHVVELLDEIKAFLGIE